MGQEGNHLTRERLKQYDQLLEEVMEARERLRRETLRAEHDQESNGYSLFGDIFDLARHRMELEQLQAQVKQERAEIEQYISGVSDILARRAFRLRYMDGMSWAAVSMKLRYSSPSGAWMLCERALEQQGEE